MKRWLVILLLAVPAVAGAQPLLDFRHDLAFLPATVNAFAAHVYRERIMRLAAAGDLDVDHALLNHLRGLLARLRPAVEYERPAAARIAWEVHVCRHCDENASAMAGGKLLVGEKFIKSIHPSDAELAYLLAHEMAHVIAEHTREFATTARYFVGMGLKRDYADIQHELDESLSLQLRMAPLYKQQELEADYIGFIVGARSGFAPRAMLSLLQKLHTDGPSLFDPHPSAERRLQQARAMLPAAERLYARGLPGH
ncbi:MAG: M48 family metalloprotease [Gammaproteobacteria bacterium]|jgi:Zn-dependent protease with chaperone function